MSATKFASTDPALIDLLESVLPNAVSSRASDRLAMAHDASHYLLTPEAVIRPQDRQQVASLLRASTAAGIGLSFRSGGTSLSGQASTDRVLVDTRRNFREIEVLDQGSKVRVQPGATVRQVNARLSPYKRKLGPDPASESACTIGGVIANNSSGMACGTEFNTYRTLDSMVFVLPSGTTIDTSAPDADNQLRELEPELYVGLAALRDRVRANKHSTQTISAQFALKNTMGYGVNAFVDHHQPVDILSHLIIGSEGTLAFVAEATFRTIPVMAHMATGLLVFEELKAATSSLEQLVAAGFATIELLDTTSLRVGQRDPAANSQLRGLQVESHAALLVEYQKATAEELEVATRESAKLLDSLPLTMPAELTTEGKLRADLWHIRKGLYATVAGNRPSGTTALLEDVAVPVGRLYETCNELIGLFERYEYEDSVIFGHAKDGNIHFMLNEHFEATDRIDRYLSFTEDLVQLILGNGGTLKAEHGTGRVMAPYVRRQYGDELYAVMQSVKSLCDPAMVLNRGVLLNEEPQSHVSKLKVTPTVEKEVDRCVECGYCEPVCPSKDLTLTPRQRIVLRREMANAKQAGDLALLNELTKDYEYEGVQTCAVDGMCATACPVLIDTGDLVRRLRAESTSPIKQGIGSLAAKNWNGITRAGGTALSLAKVVPAPIVKAATIVGRALAGNDTVPMYSADLPGGGARRQGRQAANPQAVFFAACIGTMFGPAEKGEGVTSAFLALCARAGVEIMIPEGIGSLCCGTPWKSKGLSDGYAEMQAQVVESLWVASNYGRLPIVCDAASCTEGLDVLTSAFRAEHPEIQIIDSISFIDTHVLQSLRVVHRYESIALHPTCSSTRLGTNDALERIASRLADKYTIPDGWGCCGFAGDRGMLHPELTKSATAEESAGLQEQAFDAYASTNRTCELGMTRATGHEYQHLLELLETATA
jgi:D-lactate dehydrogenase